MDKLSQSIKMSSPAASLVHRNPKCTCGNEKRIISKNDILGMLYAEKCDECYESERKSESELRRQQMLQEWPLISRRRRHEFRQSLIACGFPQKALEQRFSTFEVTAESQEAYKTAFYLPKALYKGLLLIGEGSKENPLGTGLGKTHLVNAVGKVLHAKGYQVQYSTTVDLLREIRSCFGRKKETAADEVIDRFISAQVVILDDLGVEKPSEWVQQTLYEIIDHLYANNRILLATSNHDLDSLEKRIGARLVSRLSEMCHVITYSGPDWRLK